MLNLKKSIPLLSLFVLGHTVAQALLTVTVAEVGSDVVFTATGSYAFDTAYSQTFNSGWQDDTAIFASPSGFNRASMSSYNVTPFASIVNTSFSSYSGDSWGFYGNSLIINDGYTANDSIDGTATIEDTDLTALGWNDDSTYELNFTSSGITDKIVFNTVAVPEPSTYALFIGVLTLGFVSYRRKIR